MMLGIMGNHEKAVKQTFVYFSHKDISNTCTYFFLLTLKGRCSFLCIYEQKRTYLPSNPLSCQIQFIMLDEFILHNKGFMIENSEDHDEIL